MTAPDDHRNLSGLLALALFWAVGLAILTWLVLHLLTTDYFAKIRLVAYFEPWLLLPLLMVAIYAGWARRKFLTLMSALLLVILGSPYVKLILPRIGPEPATAAPVKVMTYSVMGWNEDLDAIARAIRKGWADIVLLQEVHRSKELLAGLEGLFQKDEIHYQFQPGFGVISRFPLRILESTRSSEKVRVELPGGTVTLWNVHTSKEPHYREQLAQVEALLEDLKATGGPKLVAGDFNTTFRSVPYRLLEDVLQNAHREAGWGPGFTYPTPARRMGRFFPFLRIDHIWYSNEFYAFEAGTLDDNGGSDHYPVWARLGIVAKEKR